MTIEEFNLRPRFLMCRPQHFAVTYSINPWMDPAAWQKSGDALYATAARQWQGLFRALGANGAMVETVEPQDGLPDLVFTANSAVVLDGKALLARFRHPQRQGEEPVFAAAFRGLRLRGLIERSSYATAGCRARRRGRLPLGFAPPDVLDGLRLSHRRGRARNRRRAVRRALRRARAGRSSLLSPRYGVQPAALRSRDVLSQRVHAGGAGADPCARRPRAAHQAVAGGCRALCRQRSQLRTHHPAVELQRSAARAARRPWL